MKYKILFAIIKQPILYKFFKALLNATVYKYSNKIVLIKLDGTKVLNPKIKNLKVQFLGKNNYIEIHEPITIKNNMGIIVNGSNCVFKIGKESRIRTLRVCMSNSSKIMIGDRFSSFNSILTMLYSKNKVMKIGSDCMFSYDVIIRVSDAHTIYDEKTKEILNECKDTTIGNHVWLCPRVIVLKGSVIPDNCIVGAASIVNKEFSQTNALLAGTPAKIIKQGINWHKCAPYQWESYKKELS